MQFFGAVLEFAIDDQAKVPVGTGDSLSQLS